MKNEQISVLIPVYRSEALLKPLLTRLLTVLESLTSTSQMNMHERFEIILINDGSPDHSWDIIQELTLQHPCIRGMNLMRNFGQHNALLCGIRSARHDIIVTLDDDLQHPPEEIPKLLNKLAEGYDVVYGTPRDEQHGWLRNLASHMTKLTMQNAMGAETARHVSSFRAFKTQLRDAFTTYKGPFVSIDVLLTWGTTRFCAVQVKHDARTAGTSGYTFRKLFTHCFNMMTGFSTLPLQMASLIGFLFTLFGIAVLGYVIGRYLIRGYSVPGFPFLASIIAIFSGAQLFALGIIGEYLARMHFRMMDRPPYIVRSSSHQKPSNKTQTTENK